MVMIMKISENSLYEIIRAICLKETFIINNLNKGKQAWIALTNKKELKGKILRIGIEVIKDNEK